MLEVHTPEIERYQQLSQSQSDLLAELAQTNQDLYQAWEQARLAVARQLDNKLAEINSGICSRAIEHVCEIEPDEKIFDPRTVGIYSLADLKLHYSKVKQGLNGKSTFRDYLRRLCPDHYPDPADYESIYGIGRAVKMKDGRFVTALEEQPLTDLQVKGDIPAATYLYLQLPVLEQPDRLMMAINSFPVQLEAAESDINI